MTGILAFFLGTLTYRAKCDPSRVANAFLKSGDRFISISREEGGCAFTVYAHRRRKTDALLDKSGIKVYSIEGKGLFKRLSGLRSRYGLILGAALFVLTLSFSDSVVWDVRVEGCPSFSEDEVVERLRECGLYYGTRIKDFDHEGVTTLFLRENPEFSWIGVNFDGCVANVILRETASGKNDKKTLYSNLVAKEGGQIVRTVVSSGSLAVSPLDVVKEGDLLVSGFVEKKNGFETVRSSGEVYAEVERTFNIEVPYEYTAVISGDGKTTYSVELFGRTLGSPNAAEADANTEVRTERERLALFDRIRLPVFVTKTTAAPTSETRLERSYDEARSEAYRLMKEKTAEALSKCEVTDYEYEETDTGSSFVLKLIVRGIDDIAGERIIQAP